VKYLPGGDVKVAVVKVDRLQELGCREFSKALMWENSDYVGRPLVFGPSPVLIPSGSCDGHLVPVQGVSIGTLPHSTLERGAPVVVGSFRVTSVIGVVLEIIQNILVEFVSD
jgi:hypothetical protein